MEFAEILYGAYFVFQVLSTTHYEIYGMIFYLLDPCNSRHSVNNVGRTTLWLCNWDGYSFYQWNGESVLVLVKQRDGLASAR